jgi:arylsulfatase A-like enzyme
MIFIISDDQGWGDIGYHGSEILTPNLDRLADGGVRLEQHYVNPACSPTRAALMTGRYASRFGILGAIGGTSKQHLPYGVTTLPSYGYLHGQIDPYTHRYKFGDRTWHRNDELMEEEGHATDLITNDAIRFIRSGSQPFFLYVAFSVPHYPLAEPKRWTDVYEGRIEERSRKLFAASVSHMDEGIGRIVRELDQAGIRDNTLVVYSSDNGGQDNWMNTEELYDGRFPPDPVLGNNEPLRGWKTQLYEGGVRVPALVSWPGTVSRGEVSIPIHIVDWLPTFAGLAACSDGLPGDLDGQDVWVSLTGSAGSQQTRLFYTKSNAGASIRYGNWKLIESSAGEVELFDVEEDPGEANELSETEPERLSELLNLLRNQQEMDGEASYWEAPAP